MRLHAQIPVPQAVIDAITLKPAATNALDAERQSVAPSASPAANSVPKSGRLPKGEKSRELFSPVTGSLADSAAEILLRREEECRAVMEAVEQSDADCKEIEKRLEALRAETERQLRQLKEALEKERERGAALLTEAERAATTTEDRRAAWGFALRARCDALQDALSRRAELMRGKDAARRSAVAAQGEAVVAQYEEVRYRPLRDVDPMTAAAYTAFEGNLRRRVDRYARALDVVDKMEVLSVPILVAAGPSSITVAIPLDAAPDAIPDDDLSWRLKAVVFHAIALVAKESSEATELVPILGQVEGCAAVRLASRADLELTEILFEEAQGCRPTLAAHKIAVVIERAPDLEFVAMPETERAQPVDAPAGGGTLPEVSRRLGLRLHETVSSLVSYGFSFPDDHVAQGVEQSLCEILGLCSVHGRATENGDNNHTVEPVPACSPGLAIASRLLSKLRRDRRIGGRHTSIDNACAHGFADFEKSIARKVVKRLLAMEVLLPKLNEGSQHVSINPRRRAETLAIIDMKPEYAHHFR